MPLSQAHIYHYLISHLFRAKETLIQCKTIQVNALLALDSSIKKAYPLPFLLLGLFEINICTILKSVTILRLSILNIMEISYTDN